MLCTLLPCPSSCSDCGILTPDSVIEYINKHDGVEWVTMEQICDTFKAANPRPPKGAMLPAEPGAVQKDPGLKLKTQE